MSEKQKGTGNGADIHHLHVPASSKTPAPGLRVVSQGPEMPLLYKKPVALSPEQHADLSLEKSGFQHARDSNSVYITAVEFFKAAREYPIVFASGPDQGVVPVALLGLDPEQNLYLDDDDQWQADYIPAYVRRYPFILASGGGDEFTVCIDESCPGLNRKGQGQRLFSEDGKQSTVLENAIRLLREYQGHIQLTSEFCAALSNLAILEPMAATFATDTGDKRKLQGFMGVNEDKLRALTPEQITEALSKKYLDLIFAHILSLGCLETLGKRWQQTETPGGDTS